MKVYFYSLLCLLVLASCGVSRQNKTKVEETRTKHGQAPVNKQVEIEQTADFIEACNQKILGNTKKAISGFEKCVEDNPLNDAAWYELSVLYANSLELQKALEAAEKAFAIDSENIYYIANLSNLYSVNYEHEKAAETYKFLVDKQPENREYQITYANFLLKTTKYDETIQQIDLLEQMLGNDPDLALKKITIYGMKNDKKMAYRELTKLSETYPKETKYLSMLADMYIKDGKEKEAMKCYEKIEAINPEDPYIHFTLSEYYKKNGDEDNFHKELLKGFASPSMDANTKINVLLANYTMEEIFYDRSNRVMELLRTLAETHPEDGRSQSLMGDFYFFDQKLGMARNHYYKARELWHNPSVYVNLLQIEAEMQNVDSVYNLANEAISLFPLAPEFYYYKAVSELLKENYEEAITTLNEGIKFVVGNDMLKSSFYAYLGDCYHQTGKDSEAYSAYDNSLLLDPTNVYVLNNYSYYLSTSNTNLEKAEIMGQKVVELQPENSHYLDTYGWALFKNKKYDEALKYINEAIKHSKGDDKQTLFEHLGDVKWMLNDKNGAVKNWQEAYNMNPEASSETLKKKVENQEYYE